MKKILLIALCVVISLGLFSCKNKENDEKSKKISESSAEKLISVEFINEVVKADVWILPQTEENLKSSLWGTATISKIKAGERKTVKIKENEEKTYIIRLIDTEKAYFSVNDVVLDNNYSIVFKTDESKYDAVISVFDENGVETNSAIKAFQGVLGAN